MVQALLSLKKLPYCLATLPWPDENKIILHDTWCKGPLSQSVFLVRQLPATAPDSRTKDQSSISAV